MRLLLSILFLCLLSVAAQAQSVKVSVTLTGPLEMDCEKFATPRGWTATVPDKILGTKPNPESACTFTARKLEEMVVDEIAIHSRKPAEKVAGDTEEAAVRARLEPDKKKPASAQPAGQDK